MIESEDRGVVTIVRLARGKANALDTPLVAALIDALDRLDRSAARAGVLTGQGTVFSAGVDLTALVAGGPEYVRGFLPLLQRLFERAATFPKPLVAAANGHAVAGGMILLLACDRRLLARGAGRVGLPGVRVGLVYPAWAVEVVRFATPPQLWSTLLYTGHTWQPEEALARGVVDELVEPGRLLDRACEVAGELAAIPAARFTATKMALRGPMIEAARRLAAATDAALLEDWCAPDTLREVASFAERAVKPRRPGRA
jgi:enoyl-CoA hydratase